MKNILNIYSRQRLKDFYQPRKNLVRFAVWFSLANACLFWIIGLRYLAITLSSSTLFDNVSSVYSSLAGKVLILFFAIISYLGHLTLLAFIPCFIAIIPLIILRSPNWVFFSVSILIAFVSILLLIIDSFIFPLFHFHINLILIKILIDNGKRSIDLLGLNQFELLFFCLVSLLTLFIEIILASIVWKKVIVPARGFSWGRKISMGLFACLGFSYYIFMYGVIYDNRLFAQQTPNLPLYNIILTKIIGKPNLVNFFSETLYHQVTYANHPLNYPLHPMQCCPSDKTYNIVFIGIDSWRYDSLNPAVTPFIVEFAKQAWQFKSHVSGGNGTQPGLFSLFYSLPSNYWDAFLQQNKGPVFFKELLKNHYQVKIFASSSTTVPAFDKTVFSDIKQFRKGYLPGDTTLERDHYFTQEFVNFIKHRDINKPFFTFLFYNLPHNHCETNIPIVFPVKNKLCFRFLGHSIDKDEFVSHYKNALRDTDNEIGKVLRVLKSEKLLDKTIVIITGDHGEEFNDNGKNFWGHGSNYTPFQVQIPLLIYWPGKTKNLYTYQTTHYDIVPTLLKNVLGCKNPALDYSIGKDLLENSNRPFVIVGGYNNMGILEKNKIITLQASGSISVTDQHINEIAYSTADTKTIKNALLMMHQY